MKLAIHFSLYDQSSLWSGIVTLLLIFCGLWGWYRYRKNKYFHDKSRKMRPTHIRIQMGMVACLLAMFLWMCVWGAINNISTDRLAWLAGVGVLLTWIFQDTIKNIVAYVTLVFNDMLHLCDWIVVEQYGIDGDVEDISLTSVIVKNWDNTRSTISTQSLLNANMRNWHKTMTDPSVGRRILHNFPIDVHSVRALSQEEITQLKENLKAIHEERFISVIEEEEKKGIIFNSHLFRSYLRQWLLDVAAEQKILREPKFAVHLLDVTPDGLPLQIYAFTASKEWTEYQLEQTHIIEHVVATIEMFGLVLFQNPAGTDTNNVHLTKDN